MLENDKHLNKQLTSLISIYSILDEQILVNAIVLFLVFIIICFAQILYWMFEVRGVITRKLIQGSIGVILILRPLVLSQHFLLFIFCAIAFFILHRNRKKWWLRILYDIDYPITGSYYFALSIYLLFVVWTFHDETYIYYRLPLALMTIADSIACLVGRYFQYKPYELRGTERTVSGSTAFFVVSFILGIFLLPESSLYDNYMLLMFTSFIVAVTATAVEALSPNGTDNVTVPLSTVGILWSIETLSTYVNL